MFDHSNYDNDYRLFCKWKIWLRFRWSRNKLTHFFRFQKHHFGCCQKDATKMQWNRCNGFVAGLIQQQLLMNSNHFSDIMNDRTRAFRAPNRISNALIRHRRSSKKSKSWHESERWNHFYWLCRYSCCRNSPEFSQCARTPFKFSKRMVFRLMPIGQQ